MPRYFFDIHDDIDIVDHEGVDLPDLRTARGEAARALAEGAQDIFPENGPQKARRIKVRDETGKVVLHAALSFASFPEF